MIRRRPRSIEWRIGRTWARNPNFDHGDYCKARGALETATRQAMTTLARLAARIKRLGRWARGRIDKTYALLMENHVASFALAAPGGAIYLPAKSQPKARRFVYLVSDLALLISTAEMAIRHWSNLRGLNDRRDVRKESTERQNNRPQVMKTLLAGLGGPYGNALRASGAP